MNFIYKRAHKIPIKLLETDSKRDFGEAAYIRYYLESNGYEIIFANEFRINMRSEGLYNWSPRGTPSMIAINTEPWRMSFIVAFSKRRIEGIIASNNSIISKIFWFFLNDIWNKFSNADHLRRKPVIILDNWKLHKSKETLNFVDLKGIRFLSIPPYTPQLNGAEKMIALIRSRLEIMDSF